MCKIINIFDYKRKEVEPEEEKTIDSEVSDFEKIMEENTKNKERLRKERLNANKSVLRSYRIKS